MKLIAALAGLALLVPATSLGSPPKHQWTSLRTLLCATPQVMKTGTIPAAAVPQRIQVWVNGRELRGWNEAPRIAGLGGHGVVALISFTRKAGPATVRLANALNHCVHVRVLIVWR